MIKNLVVYLYIRLGGRGGKFGALYFFDKNILPWLDGLKAFFLSIKNFFSGKLNKYESLDLILEKPANWDIDYKRYVVKIKQSKLLRLSGNEEKNFQSRHINIKMKMAVLYKLGDRQEKFKETVAQEISKQLGYKNNNAIGLIKIITASKAVLNGKLVEITED